MKPAFGAKCSVFPKWNFDFHARGRKKLARHDD
jgi:hypothetical protein